VTDKRKAITSTHCVHFAGFQHADGTQREWCRAGVYYADVRDSTQPGQDRWPCMTAVGDMPATTCCASRRLQGRRRFWIPKGGIK